MKTLILAGILAVNRAIFLPHTKHYTSCMTTLV